MSKQILLTTPRGKTAVVPIITSSSVREEDLFETLLQAAQFRDTGPQKRRLENDDNNDDNEDGMCHKKQRRCPVQFLHQGRHLSKSQLSDLVYCGGCPNDTDNDDNATITTDLYLSMALPLLGGIDRQNRVGSKFGGGGVSSSQQQERERKERLKQLALESIDLAKDPYLMRNHLGSYECKLCLTLHTNEANYLAHTQGKKHQQGLARRAHMEQLRTEKEGPAVASVATKVVAPKRVRIGRPAYQVFKSRDADTTQRCLSFELSFPEMEADLQPRHRFMSAFEQRVETPPDRRYQYLLFAAEPYETVAFKIPNEPVDKEPGRFVTHWDPDEKKFTVTLYFMEQNQLTK